MTHRPLDGISSGAHYRVTHLDGRRPGSAAEFVGDTAFLVHHDDQHLHIDGVGRRDPVGTGVQFYQKDRAHDGRDVRIWHLRSLPDQQLIAEHVTSLGASRSSS